MGEGDGLGALQMGVARHDRLQMLGCDLAQGVHEVEHQCADFSNFTADIQAHVERNLVVSRARGVQALACVADALGQDLLVCHVDILIELGREVDLARLDVCEDAG